ncbi:MAG: CYTH domain-containing protein [Lentisphaeria bacterium]|nr:CYTH domain-containing protein [Lentisphaeria bacterium]
MATEIERKFLLKNDSWRQQVESTHYIRQGYARFREHDKASFRVRIKDDKAFLTLKTPVVNYSRKEFEYAIPRQDAEELLQEICSGGEIEKKRHIVICDSMRWEIDEFLGDNAGLLVAEIELESPEQSFSIPPWLGREVSDDFRYFNSKLLLNPYKNWKEKA